ncbi:MAG TPA: glycosyltransferase family 39 protein [Pyrinomonadaceae bacterium]|jgi:4-amino-4-deoxy-L-arabinose transferase-like glycosyltransferase
MRRWLKYQLLKLRRRNWLPPVFIVLIISATLAAHIAFAVCLASDESNDGKLYSQIAVNVLEQKIYAIEAQPPYHPTLIRLPGYPLFLAAVYAVFGHGNDTAVRVVQAVFDTLTCLLVAFLTWSWTGEKYRKRAARFAFFLAALCPFTAIYAATLLTETLTTFLFAAITLAATFAFKTKTNKSKLVWWILAGFLTGLAVLLRPDSGLLALGVGLTLVFTELFKRDSEDKFISRLVKTVWQGAVFSLAFVLVLVPWTIRNERLFGVFQPLAPAHAEMPGEFVPYGYLAWLRTWVDDQRYIEPMIWNLEEKQIKIEDAGNAAFDSEDEKNRVAALLNQYNNPPDDVQDDAGEEAADGLSGDDDQTEDDSDDAGQSSDDEQNVQMTPEIDAGFAQIAQERIARAPFRYYVKLPVKRAAALWFDTHSKYYSFDGELFPLNDLDEDENQHIWLPIFDAVTWLYTVLAVAGAFVLWSGRKTRWLILVVLLIFPRIVFFASLENPEPRYVVELFAFTAVLGGIALARIKFKWRRGLFSIRFFCGRD